MRINEISDLEQVTPVEDKYNKSFYLIPGIPNFSISVNGEVKNINSNKILKTYLHKNKYICVNLKLNNKAINCKLHRLLAITFIGRPSRHLNKEFNLLTVNHIDGVRVNNSISNLEWCTNVENINHFRLNFIHLLDKPVLAKNILSNKIIEFSSIAQCSNYFGLHKATLHKCLNIKKPNIFHKDFFIFKYKESQIPWVLYPKEMMKELGKSNRKITDVFLIEKIKQLRKDCLSMRAISYTLGVSNRAVKRILEES